MPSPSREIQSSETAAAVARLQENPFSVEEEDLELLSPDVVFRLSAEPWGLRAHLRPKSTASRLLKRVPGAFYVKRERCFFFPVEGLTGFLKKLRDKKCSFAVEAKAGAKLRRSAVLRERVLESSESLSARELRSALFVPFVAAEPSESGELRISLECALTEQLRSFLPQCKSYSDRVALAQNISEEELLRMLLRVRQSGERLWLTREIEQFLEARGEEYSKQLSGTRFDESILAAVSVEEAWAQLPDGRVGILCDSDCSKVLFADAKRLGLTLISSKRCEEFHDQLFVPLPESKILEYRERLNVDRTANGQETLKEGEEFLALLEELSRRRERLRVQREFTRMADADPPWLDEEIKQQLYPHQRVAVTWLLANPQALLGDDMGLGKTLSVLASFHALRNTEGLEQLLVVCPNSLTRNWQREAQLWIPGMKLVPVPEGKKARTAFLEKVSAAESDWISGIVINYEAFRLADVQPVLKELCQSRKTMLVVDESQRAKNPRSKIFAALADLAPSCPRRVLLSGTPTPRDVTDIWSQVLLLDEGERFGRNFYRWLETVAELGNKWSDFAIKRFKPDAVEDAVYRVRELLLRRRKEEVVDLPEKIYSVRDIVLRGSQKARYEEIRKDLLVRIRAADGELYEKEITNILEEFLRAVQAASNPRLIDELWEGEPAKFLELDEIVREIVEERGGKIVVWTNYRRNVAELVERYSTLGSAAFTGDTPNEERTRLISEFQKEDSARLRVLVAIPAAGGVGITLTAAQTAVYLDKTWNAEHWMQSVDRLHRIGQKGAVHILSLHASLADELIYKNLLRKQKQQAELLGDNVACEGERYPSRVELLEALGGKS